MHIRFDAEIFVGRSRCHLSGMGGGWDVSAVLTGGIVIRLMVVLPPASVRILSSQQSQIAVKLR